VSWGSSRRSVSAVDGLTVTVVADYLKTPNRTASTATANSVKAPAGFGRAPRCARSHGSRACSDRLASLVYRRSPHCVRRTVGGLPEACRPFHSRPCRPVGQSVRVGLKGAARSSPPRRRKHWSERCEARSASTASGEAASSERSAQRGAAVRASRGFHAVCGGGFSCVCRSFHAVRSAETNDWENRSRSNDGHTLLCHSKSC